MNKMTLSSYFPLKSCLSWLRCYATKAVYPPPLVLVVIAESKWLEELIPLNKAMEWT